MNIFPYITKPIIIREEAGKESCIISSSLYDGRIYLNNSAKEVLFICDGVTDMNKIISDISHKFSGSSLEEIKAEVSSSIDQFIKLGIMNSSEFSIPSCNIILKKSPLSLQLVYIEITRACNLQCIHCYDNAGEVRDKELGTNDFLKLIDNLADIGLTDIVLTGGEPFMRKDIFQIINAINRKNIRFSIFTNALLITPSIVDKLVEYSPEFIAISLDGSDASVHERIRGKNTFDKTINAIKLIKSKGLKVRINHTLTSKSITQLDNFMKLMKDLQIDDIFFDRFDSLGRGKEQEDLVIPVEQGYEIKSMLDKYSKNENVNISSYEAIDNTIIADNGNLCGVGITSCYIKADGELTFCPVMSSEEYSSVGDVLKSDIITLWNSEKWNELRHSSVQKISQCSTCSDKSVCLGGCKAKAYNAYGNFNHPDPWACSQFKKNSTEQMA